MQERFCTQRALSLFYLESSIPDISSGLPEVTQLSSCSTPPFLGTILSLYVKQQCMEIEIDWVSFMGLLIYQMPPKEEGLNFFENSFLRAMNHLPHYTVSHLSLTSHMLRPPAKLFEVSIHPYTGFEEGEFLES